MNSFNYLDAVIFQTAHYRTMREFTDKIKNYHRKKSRATKNDMVKCSSRISCIQFMRTVNEKHSLVNLLVTLNCKLFEFFMWFEIFCTAQKKSKKKPPRKLFMWDFNFSIYNDKGVLRQTFFFKIPQTPLKIPEQKMPFFFVSNGKSCNFLSSGNKMRKKKVFDFVSMCDVRQYFFLRGIFDTCTDNVFIDTHTQHISKICEKYKLCDSALKFGSA